MKVVIVGPGAMGCLFAGYFAKKKQHDILILDRNPRRAKRLNVLHSCNRNPKN